MKIKIISRWQEGKPAQCHTCLELKKSARAVMDKLGLKDTPLEECKSEEEYKSYGVIVTPVLVINGKVRLSGRVAPKEMLRKLIKFEMEAERKK